MRKKNKLRVYVIIELKRDIDCWKCLNEVSDMGFKLLFRFRSEIHGLNEELGRHSTRKKVKLACFLFVSMRKQSNKSENIDQV